MLTNLKLPTGREWKPYLLRHSLATIVRNGGVGKWDLEGYMGHDATGSTETYAVGRFESIHRASGTFWGRSISVFLALCAETAPKWLYPFSPRRRPE